MKFFGSEDETRIKEFARKKNIEENNYNTILKEAINSENHIISLILVKNIPEIHIAACEKEKILVLAAEKGNYELLRSMILNPYYHRDIFSEYIGQTFYILAQKGNIDIFECFLSNFTNIPYYHKEEALLSAISLGRTDVIKIINNSLIQNMDSNSRGKGLVLAAEIGHTEIFNIFISTPSFLKGLSYFMGTAFEIASEKGHLEIVKIILQKPELIAEKGTFYKNASMKAASYGQLEIFKYMLANSDLMTEISSIEKSNAFKKAAEQGFLNVIQFILENPDLINDISVKDKSKALQLAAEKGHQHIVKFMLTNSKFTSNIPEGTIQNSIKNISIKKSLNVIILLKNEFPQYFKYIERPPFLNGYMIYSILHKFNDTNPRYICSLLNEWKLKENINPNNFKEALNQTLKENYLTFKEYKTTVQKKRREANLKTNITINTTSKDKKLDWKIIKKDGSEITLPDDVENLIFQYVESNQTSEDNTSNLNN